MFWFRRTVGRVVRCFHLREPGVVGSVTLTHSSALSSLNVLTYTSPPTTGCIAAKKCGSTRSDRRASSVESSHTLDHDQVEGMPAHWERSRFGPTRATRRDHARARPSCVAKAVLVATHERFDGSLRQSAEELRLPVASEPVRCRGTSCAASPRTHSCDEVSDWRSDTLAVEPAHDRPRSSPATPCRDDSQHRTPSGLVRMRRRRSHRRDSGGHEVAVEREHLPRSRQRVKQHPEITVPTSCS